eukprot:GFUD01016383.1.p1 GENE.GFUD01016383.1~~GFUD01016383.1.p1  ORF type:complete len:194 (+),score=38.60 GFUD01016383.1:69-650(+)
MGCCCSVPKEGIICTLKAEEKDSEPPQFREDLNRSGLLVSEAEFDDFKVFVKQLNGTITDCYGTEQFKKIKKIQTISFIGFLSLWAFGGLSLLIASPEISSLISPGMYRPRNYILLGLVINFVLSIMVSKCLRRKKDKILLDTINPVVETFNDRNKIRRIKVQFQPRKWKQRFERTMYRSPAKLLMLRELTSV